MKRFLLTIISSIISILWTVSAIAADRDYNSEQYALRSEIMSFIKDEGFSPEIDSDGDVKFKYEGHAFYVVVSDNDENPMYVVLCSYYNYSDECTSDKVLLASKALNKYKAVKVLCFDNTFRIGAEMYMRDAELFKEAFYKLLSQIDSVRENVLNECRNVGGSTASISAIPFIVTKIEVANTDYDGTIIQDFGSSIYDFKSKYLQPRITVTPYRNSGTYTVYVKLYKDNVLQRNTSTSPADYTNSKNITISGSSSQTFTLLGFGSKTAGTWSMGTYRYEIWINDYCIGSKTFKII